MNVVDALVVSIGIDASGLKQGAKEATSATTKLSADLKSTAEVGEKAQITALGSIAKAWNALVATQRKASEASVQAGKTMAGATERVVDSGEKAIRTFGALFLLFAGAGSLKNFASSMIALDASMGRLAHNTGTTTNVISGIGRAAERMGGSLDGAVGGIRSLSDAYQDLRLTGNNAIMEPLAKLQGLSGKTITFGKDVHANLLSIADALHVLDQRDPAEADNLARKILGDEGLANLAKKGRPGVLAAEAAVPKTSPADAAAMAELQSQLVGVRQGFQDIGNSILMDFGPAMISGAKWVKELVDANRPLIESKVKEWITDVGVWFKAHKGDVEAFGTAIGQLATAAGGLAVAFAAQSPTMQALELFALTMGGRVLGAINLVSGAMLAMGKLPAPTWALAFLGAGGAAGAMHVPTVDEYGRVTGNWGGDDESKNPSYVGPKSDAPQADAAPDAADGSRPTTTFSTLWAGLKRMIGLGGDTRTKDDLATIAKATGEIRDLVKSGASLTGSINGVTASSGGLGGSGQHNNEGLSPGAVLGDRARGGRRFDGTAPHPASGPTGVPYEAKSATEGMGISSKEWDAFREGVTDIEGKRYDRMGGAGGRFAGRYQMGGAEITETASRLGVARPSNAQFLADPAMQERFFENYTLDHHRTLMENARYAAMSPRERLKILGYAHNQGTGSPRRGGGAWSYLNSGAVGHDAFGTAGTAYLGTIGRRLSESDKAIPSPAPAPGGTTAGDVGSKIASMKSAGLLTDEQCVTLAMASVGVKKGSEEAGANVHDWRKGAGADQGTLKPGTPLATFLNRDGSQSDRYAGGGAGTPGAHLDHAGIFQKYVEDAYGKRIGMTMAEQYQGSRGVHLKDYLFGKGSGEGDGSNYHAVLGPDGKPLGGSRNPMADSAQPVTVDHAVRHVLSALHHAQRLTHHNDNPVPVVLSDKSGKEMLYDRRAGAISSGIHHKLDKAFGPQHAAAYGAMMKMAESGRYATHATSNIDRSISSDTTINGGIHVHSAATDARGIAADIEPHLKRADRAGRADYGLG